MSTAEQTPPPEGQQPQPRRRGRLVVGAVFAVLLLIVVVAGVRAVAGRVEATGTGGLTIADQAAVDQSVDHRTVAFGGTLLQDGRSWSSASARGKVLVVNYWASWCGPCRAEQSALSKVARAWRDRGVAFIGVNIQDNKASAIGYVREFGVPYPSLFDPSAKTAAALRVTALPTTFVLDRDGVIAYQLIGRTSEPVLAARLQALLARGGRWAP